jgi:hypothetical protein
MLVNPRVLFVVGILLLPHTIQSQQCTVAAKPALEFQVEQPAQLIPDDTHPHPVTPLVPALTDHSDWMLAQFVVDTAGVPLPSSYRWLKLHVSTTSDSVAFTDTIKAVLPKWRFTPARSGTCPVPQLLYTKIVW